ncbi:MAG: hypothetical protein QMD09_10430, partial [Desulfatibacillaceae bacterium]|nr:hypothetical protein [Desulfatibacillaceae bacterium]
SLVMYQLYTPALQNSCALPTHHLEPPCALVVEGKKTPRPCEKCALPMTLWNRPMRLWLKAKTPRPVMPAKAGIQ